MKNYLQSIFCVLVALTLCTAAVASEADQKEEIPVYTVIVNDQILDLNNLPLAPYKEGNTVMVPLRKISEALGYTVKWNAEIKSISVDNEYIQQATLFDGTATVIFAGHLKIIDMSRQIKNSAKTVIHNGYAYVPVEFFGEFFNDVTTESTIITITSSKSELHTM